jgi:hypothetical protein
MHQNNHDQPKAPSDRSRRHCEMFTDKNDAREKSYIRVKNDIGSKEQMIVVWIKLVADETEFITDLVCG